ncbi:TetR family transcriptional regulator [Oceanicola sp. 22II-s10i]|uniref:TetR/AcrR family transcriptional regulator n=1 Tax=Oceanicola sp. 22II-s10i TaxID=1317116 RepID=UPI000B5228AA|nr:TetR/AcrR family transcriptional regulator [Oceanicola sp. 22II-s10i]OWU83841.1 TetR family transcriptional regulator [Oceanicola sp. 22II-s10i]
MSQDPEKPRRGRPPSAAARRKALSAARAILLQDGFGRLTMEKVAQASGVGKPTIYRNWANAQDLALAALIDEAPDPAPEPDLPPDRALTDQLTRICAAFASTRGRQIAQALAAADPDSEFTRAFRNRVIFESREAGRAILTRAIATGLLPPQDDMETLLDMIYGPVFFRLLAGHQPLDATLAETVTARIFPSR